MNTKTPYDEFPLCEVCGGDPDNESDNGCVCPSCMVCGVTGDPDCYEVHDLNYNRAQVNRFRERLTTMNAESEQLQIKLASVNLETARLRVALQHLIDNAWVLTDTDGDKYSVCEIDVAITALAQPREGR